MFNSLDKLTPDEVNEYIALHKELANLHRRYNVLAAMEANTPLSLSTLHHVRTPIEPLNNIVGTK